jgi:hypothetical protein
MTTRIVKGQRKVKETEWQCKVNTCGGFTHNYQALIDELPESPLKAKIKEWQSRQKIVSGAMSVSALFYRWNLGYILYNIDKPSLMDELDKAISSNYQPKEYGQLELKHGQRFKQIFGCSLHDYMDLRVGFFITKFDDFIKPNENESLKDAIKRKYGDEGVKLIEELL